MKAPWPVKVVVVVTVVFGLVCGLLWAAFMDAPAMGPVEAGVRCGFAAGAFAALGMAGRWWLDKIEDLEDREMERRARERDQRGVEE